MDLRQTGHSLWPFYFWVSLTCFEKPIIHCFLYQDHFREQTRLVSIAWAICADTKSRWPYSTLGLEISSLTLSLTFFLSCHFFCSGDSFVSLFSDLWKGCKASGKGLAMFSTEYTPYWATHCHETLVFSEDWGKFQGVCSMQMQPAFICLPDHITSL